ncbi:MULTISPECIES: SDR family oxidoreductase [Thermomonosporaceae]|uniref:SDR family oxidoreductase n=1 Tax=Thermomonosporaceae TaxID=2012 RepID=UPI00255A7703|nr:MULTISPECIES: SDR family oxidoreductase [Thermomonosporaceae]MDL4774360.1 SDR family oxidoreductase [Actinomadura xylanilytica]
MSTILLTGASGVVGGALLPRLRGHRVIALTRRRAVSGVSLRGDVSAPGLGLGGAEHRGLLGEVDTVVHCAAVTDFGVGAERTNEVNVLGTERILEFTAAAGARLVYLSTAFVTREREAADAASPLAYVASKIAAEEQVRAAGLPTAIVRPSVVIGDSVTGALAPIQGFYAFLRSVLRDQVRGVVPCGPGDRVDFVPSDVVAGALAALVDLAATGEFWLTSGEHAPTAQRLFELAEHAAARGGRRLAPVRLASTRTARRLAGAARPGGAAGDLHGRLAELLGLAVMFDGAAPFPTSLGTIQGGPPAPSTESVEAAFLAALDYISREHVRPVRGPRPPAPRAALAGRTPVAPG